MSNLSLAERQPVALGSLGAVVAAVITVLVAFGVDLTQNQTVAILGLVAVLGPILPGLIAQFRAVAAAKVVNYVDNGVVKSGEAAIEKTGGRVATVTSNSGNLVSMSNVNPSLVNPEANIRLDEAGETTLQLIGIVLAVVGGLLLVAALAEWIHVVIWFPVITILLGVVIYVFSDRRRI